MKKFIFLLPVILFSCNKNNRTAKSDRTDYDKAYNYLKTAEKDSAFKYFNKAKDFFIQEDNPSFAGSCLVNMAILQCENGDYYGSQETALSAIKYLNPQKDTLEIVGNYNNLGITCQNLKEYNKAAQFYNKAVGFSKDPIDQLTLLNNKAISYTYLKKHDSAIHIFNKILAFPNIKVHAKIFSKVYDNLAYTKFSQNPAYNAEPELNEALQIRKETNDNDGLNASFYHLTEYFENKDPKKALYYANENWQIAKKNNSPDDQLKALQKIITLESSNNSKHFFLKYQNLNDSLQTARNKAKNQFALIRFDAEKMKNEIAENEAELLKRNIGLLSLSILLVSGGFWYKKRKKRLEQEKELEVKNTQLKMSKKVHDVVANGIYQVMTKIENQENFDKEKALDELEFVYEKSRDISYEKEDAKDEQDFSEKISNSIGSFNNDTVKTYIAGNEKNIWENVSQPKQEEIYQIIRELLVNMKKHSKASVVSFRFERINNEITIHYKDNGIGMSGAVMYKNGLSNAVSRIEILKGQIIFDTETEKGLKVDISFPVY
ncbi:tetratricopeptide repeat-containing sensor histidine kinase [Chryseobacterium sp. 22532]|uniref:tetratricopeptide repeat-containing sensor histidine kinase n=1 Tax=Chryseobacterium sp. 22532 TaxID=3453938 RepID=UPI003F85DDC4